MSFRILTIEDVAGLFQNERNAITGRKKGIRPVDEETIRKALAAGELGGRKVANKWWTTESAIERWLTGPSVKTHHCQD